MKRLLGFILFLIIFMISTVSHAILFNLDRYNIGDRLITLDTITGLEWLDVNETQGMSYRDVWSDTTLDNEGWRYATNFEVGDLFDTYFTVANLGQMQGFFGVTSTVYDPSAGDRRFTHGFVEFVDGSGEYGSPYGHAVIIRYVSGGTSSWFISNFGTAWNPGYSEPTVGNWLVREHQQITVLSPNGGEELFAGLTFEITWSYEEGIDYVKIEYSNNNGTDWIEIVASTENNGSYMWEVSSTSSEECLVRITDINSPVFDTSDTVFSIIANQSSVANAGPDQTVSAGDFCDATVGLDGTGSYDPDEDEISYNWIGSFGAVSGPTPTVTLPLGIHTITLNVNDGRGGTSLDTVVVIVNDTTPPVPDLTTLPTVTGVCSATITSIPTATDNCADTVMGSTNDPLTYMEQGTYSVSWTFEDANGNVTTQTQTVIVGDTTAPVPNLPELPMVTGECSATILSAPKATDNCAGEITGTTSNPLSYSEQGTYTVTWIYNDGKGNTSTQSQTVIVRDLTDPIPDEATLPTATGECSAEITSAPKATDNCAGKIIGTTSDPLTYTQQGTYTVNWAFDDGNGQIANQTQKVIVNDITPPSINVSASPNILWPPNHKMVHVTATVIANDNCDAEPAIELVSIVMNESDETITFDPNYDFSLNDGQTSDDIQIFDYFNFDLRCERSGKSEGRTYTITYSATDASGNKSTASTEVLVPHSM